MSINKEMVGVLEEMVKAAEQKDKDKVLELRRKYDLLDPDKDVAITDPLGLQADLCRQSCIFAVSVYMNQYDACIRDAKERLEKVQGLMDGS